MGEAEFMSHMAPRSPDSSPDYLYGPLRSRKFKCAGQSSDCPVRDPHTGRFGGVYTGHPLRNDERIDPHGDFTIGSYSVAVAPSIAGSRRFGTTGAVPASMSAT